MEHQERKLKQFLRGWSMVLVQLKPVLLWEQPWHPCAIIGFTTLLSFIIWLMDLNTLALIALLALLMNFLDFIVPIICESVYGSKCLTEQHEKEFDGICRDIYINYKMICGYISQFFNMRGETSTKYHIISISALSILTWFAASFDNIILLYIFTTSVLLWPGIRQLELSKKILSLAGFKDKKIE